VSLAAAAAAADAAAIVPALDQTMSDGRGLHIVPFIRNDWQEEPKRKRVSKKDRLEDIDRAPLEVLQELFEWLGGEIIGRDKGGCSNESFQ